MGSIIKRAYTQIIMNLIRLAGAFSIITAFKEFFAINQEMDAMTLSIVAILYLVFSPWMVSLPSGAGWRPGIAFILFSMLYFDVNIAIMVAIPGTLYCAIGKKKTIVNFLLTIGHLSLGIYFASFVYTYMKNLFPNQLGFYLSIIICLLLHFCVNRFVSAIIVAHRKQKSIMKQIYAIKSDLNWGYSCTYIIGMMMFLIFRVYNIPGLLLVSFLLITIYKSFTYFQRFKMMEEKVYLDGLTNAENRLSWEEFSGNRALCSGNLFMLDLDYFKMINDTYGHEFGDQLLKEVVSFIKKEMKRKYRFFRYGGDEFILFVFSDKNECLKVSDEISDILCSQNNLWKQRGLNVSISFGNAFFSEKDKLENTLRSADKLMYMQKFEKRNIRRSLMK
jgi:diguanylate cyclase (GGDEF)-like protein